MGRCIQMRSGKKLFLLTYLEQLLVMAPNAMFLNMPVTINGSRCPRRALTAGASEGERASCSTNIVTLS